MQPKTAWHAGAQNTARLLMSCPQPIHASLPKALLPAVGLHTQCWPISGASLGLLQLIRSSLVETKMERACQSSPRRYKAVGKCSSWWRKQADVFYQLSGVGWPPVHLLSWDPAGGSVKRLHPQQEAGYGPTTGGC